MKFKRKRIHSIDDVLTTTTIKVSFGTDFWVILFYIQKFWGGGCPSPCYGPEESLKFRSDHCFNMNFNSFAMHLMSLHSIFNLDQDLKNK